MITVRACAVKVSPLWGEEADKYKLHSNVSFGIPKSYKTGRENVL